MNRTLKMQLFNSAVNDNLLPRDGVVYYYGEVLSPAQADYYFAQLYHHIAWQHDEAILYGKRITTARKVAWYGDQPYLYTYSGTTKRALPWSRDLLELKAQVEQTAGVEFNSCLLNLYEEGNTGMAWHSDSERMLAKNAAIVSLSLGAQRRFAFKHIQTQEVIALELAHGSLLIMQGQTQTYWRHSLPKMKAVKAPRINLTFRIII